MSNFLKNYASEIENYAGFGTGAGASSGASSGAGAGSVAPQVQKPKNNYIKDNSSFSVNVKRRGNTDKELSITKFNITPRAFLQRSTVFYGTSGSGKTFMIRDFMYSLRNYFPRVWVFVPAVSRKFYEGVVPSPMIRETVTLEAVSDIFKYQDMARAIYSRANDLQVLRSLFLRVASYKAKIFERKIVVAEKEAIKNVKEKFKDPGICLDKEEQIQDIMKERLRNLYKGVISDHEESLGNARLSEDERYALKYRGFNPHTLVIFDDVMMELDSIIKKGKKEKDPVVQNFFFKGRHIFLTTMYAMQSDKMFDADLRKNAFNSIFTSQDEALSWFSRTANGVTADERKVASAIAEDEHLFAKSGEHAHKKLVYLKDAENKYQWIKSTGRGKFKMCGAAIRRYCKKVEEKGKTMDKSNKFFKRFEEYSRD